MKVPFIITLRILVIALFGFALLFTAGGCKKSEDTKPMTSSSGSNTSAYDVGMQNNSFVPRSITITAGRTVTWKNTDSMAHTVTANNGAFDSGSIAAGATYSHTFTATGTFDYHCSFHSGMVGTVVVQ